jgi:hypothetical protein
MFNKIKNILLSAFPDFTIRDGKPITDFLIKPAAAINETFETEKVNLLQKMFIGNYKTLTTEEFDLLASNYINTERKLGRNSLVNLRIYLSQRTDLVLDQERGSFKDINGNRFLPRYDYAIPASNLKFDYTTQKYYADVTVVSENALGDEYFLNAGDLNTYIGENPFVDYVLNLNDSILVDFQESNEEFYNRIRQNGLLINSSKNNFFANLLYQSFPDIRKFLPVGSGDFLMNRDLTFNSIDAELAISEYNFYKKKKGSKIDNANKLYSGLLSTIDIDKLDLPEILILDYFDEIKQAQYESIAYNDGSFITKSSLIENNIFSLYSSAADFADNGWFISNNGGQWNKGTSYITFTNEVGSGIQLKGNYITEPTLANLDSGLVMYKEDNDPRNKEYQLDFVIDDFEFVVNTTRSDLTETSSRRVISNTNPLYFTILKNGLRDLTKNMECSTYDGYGVVIKKTVNSNQPNVFIVDGSSGVGDIAWEQEILLSGSERILAGVAIPLKAGTKYTCLMQVNENYGLKVIIKNEFNATLGQLVVGSGAVNADYTTTYKSEESFEEKTKDSFVQNTSNPPRKYQFINTTNESLFCSSFLDLSVSIAKSVEATKVTKTGDRLLAIDLNSNPSQFNDFRLAIAGDIIVIQNLPYLVTNVFNNFEIEVDKDLPDITLNGVHWAVWRSLSHNSDYVIPNKAFFDSLLITDLGVSKIITLVGVSKISNTELKFIYMNRLGETVETILPWNSSFGTNMITYTAQNSPVPSKLVDVNIFDNDVSASHWFKTKVGGNQFQAIYFTQIGYDNLESNYIRIKINNETPYVIHKDDFEQGYFLPVDIPDNIRAHYIDAVRLKVSGYTFTKDTHYKVLDTTIADLLVPVNFFSLYTGDIEILAETNSLEVTTIASNKGQDKIYVSTGAITTDDYYSVIINTERYFIQSIDLNSQNSPFSNKKIEIKLDRPITTLENVSVKIRKRSTFITNSSHLRFGYRYSIFNNRTVDGVWNYNDTVNIKTGSRNLIKNLDFMAEQSVEITKYYISDEIFNLSTFGDADILTFNFKYRSLIEDRASDEFNSFKPMSNGSYLGIGVKSINNGSWRLLNFKIRKLLESHSAYIGEFFVGDKPITNEDRLKIKLNTYSINLNASSTPVNGSKILIYNFENLSWESIYDNTKTSTDNVILEFYNGEGAESRQFDFGYWEGSTFITVNSSFYPKNYVNYDGNLYIAVTSKGKNEKTFSSNLIFGEAKLSLEYINIVWQRRSGVHLGNKMDLLVASESTSQIKNISYRISSPTKTLILDPNLFSLPIIKINSILLEGSSIPIGFELVNLNSKTRFTTKEELQINFTNIVAPGSYIINYECFPHIKDKQFYIDSLQSHVDILVKQFVPCFTKINLAYYGVIDAEATINEIHKYVRFANILDVNYIKAILGANGAIMSTEISEKPIVELLEYDLETQPIIRTVSSSYTLKPEKYFEIKKADINLIRLS